MIVAIYVLLHIIADNNYLWHLKHTFQKWFVRILNSHSDRLFSNDLFTHMQLYLTIQKWCHACSYDTVFHQWNRTIYTWIQLKWLQLNRDLFWPSCAQVDNAIEPPVCSHPQCAFVSVCGITNALWSNDADNFPRGLCSIDYFLV